MYRKSQFHLVSPSQAAVSSGFSTFSVSCECFSTFSVSCPIQWFQFHAQASVSQARIKAEQNAGPVLLRRRRGVTAFHDARVEIASDLRFQTVRCTSDSVIARLSMGDKVERARPFSKDAQLAMISLEMNYFGNESVFRCGALLTSACEGGGVFSSFSLRRSQRP